MKTFAQLKRDLKVGTKIKCVFNLHGKYLNTIRKITRVQTNAVYIETNNGERTFESWLPFPKKSCFVKYENNTFEFYANDNLSGDTFKLLAYEIMGD